jgi:hypothetical protein
MLLLDVLPTVLGEFNAAALKVLKFHSIMIRHICRKIKVGWMWLVYWIVCKKQKAPIYK